MRVFGIIVILCAGLVSQQAAAQPLNETVKIGELAPAFQGLPGTDGRLHSLGDYLRDGKATVLVVTANHCPIAQFYEERMIEFAREYAPKGVKLVAISVGRAEEDRLPAMKEHARDRGFNFDYLHDESQRIGKALGAAVTPEFFVLDAAGKFVYSGAMDDNLTASRVAKRHLRDAVESVLNGRPLEVTKTRRRGCSIEYEKE